MGTLQRARRRDVMEWGARDVSKLKPLVLKMPRSMSRIVTSTTMDDNESADLCLCCAAPKKSTRFLIISLFHVSTYTVPSHFSQSHYELDVSSP